MIAMGWTTKPCTEKRSDFNVRVLSIGISSTIGASVHRLIPARANPQYGQDFGYGFAAPLTHGVWDFVCENAVLGFWIK